MARIKVYKKEADVKKQIKKVLTDRGWWWFMPPANAYGVGGISDILCLKDGVFLAVEAKFGDNKPTPLQKGFLNSVNAAGGIGVVVNETTVGSFERWLDLFQQSADLVAQRKQVPPEMGAEMLDLLQAMTGDLVI